MNVIDHYDSTKINIGNAVELDDDNYFCKLTYNNSPLVIKTNRLCYYRKRPGLYKSSDDYIHVSITSKDYLVWFEQFYHDSINIFQKASVDWFEDPLTITDIECCFINPLKSNIKNNCFDVLCSIDESRLIIVDSNENMKNLEGLEDSNIIPTFHIKGIKFNSKHFLFDIELNNLYIVSDTELNSDETVEEPQIQEPQIKEPEIQNPEIKQEIKELKEELRDNEELNEYEMKVDNLEETDLQLEELGIYEVYELINTKIKENMMQNIRNILISKKIKTKLDLAEMVDDEEE